MKYYPALKRSEFSSLENIGRNFKCTLLSKRSKFEKATNCMISTR
jgi:hypothetical protein